MFRGRGFQQVAYSRKCDIERSLRTLDSYVIEADYPIKHMIRSARNSGVCRETKIIECMAIRREAPDVSLGGQLDVRQFSRGGTGHASLVHPSLSACISCQSVTWRSLEVPVKGGLRPCDAGSSATATATTTGRGISVSGANGDESLQNETWPASRTWQCRWSNRRRAMRSRSRIKPG